ncbi:MAG: polysaccharide biosynthesis C-terminal domain-containing protein, partial [Puniceicoccales bacterium]|nr:polysaccharide biosynthesis C-terminal domain-containing protein [Puniceicoccales bacterium]
GIIALVGRGFNSLNDTRTPAKMALWVFLVNIVLSPVLGWLFKAPGLAAANLVAAVFQYVVLWKILRGKNSAFCAESFWKPLVQCLAAAVVMGGCVHVAWRFCDLWHPVDGAANLAVDALKLAAVIGIGTAVYFFILWILRYPELSFLLAKRRKDSGTPVS